MSRLRPHWRKMTWVILIWTAICLVWIVAGTSSGVSHNRAYCKAHTDAYFSMHDCLTASNTGTGIGVVLVFVLWFMGFVVLALIWFMSRPRARGSGNPVDVR